MDTKCQPYEYAITDGELTAVSKIVDTYSPIDLDIDNDDFVRFIEWASHFDFDVMRSLFKKCEQRTPLEGIIFVNCLSDLVKALCERPFLFEVCDTNELSGITYTISWSDGGARVYSLEPHPQTEALPVILIRPKEWEAINAALALNDPNNKLLQDFWGFANSGVERTFVYLDISDYSTLKDAEQVLALNELNDTVNADTVWDDFRAFGARSQIIETTCIGDGYIYVFESAWGACIFAAVLAYTIEKRRKCSPVEIHFRIGVHTGTVLKFWDRGYGKTPTWNYAGSGINDARRVLDAIGKEKDDVVFISAETRDNLHPRLCPENFEPGQLQNRGRIQAKHNRWFRIYEMDHVGWATNLLNKRADDA